jgi:sterol desaturase/sphingolipid hydroxylase (fatty acid hydroxylase superfamily)
MIDSLNDLARHWGNTYLLDFGRYLIAAALVSGLVLALGRWGEARRIQQRRASFADRRREFLNSARTAVIFAANGTGVYVLARTGMATIIEGTPSLWIGLAEFVAIVVAHDAYFYWMHRGLHTRAMFRRAHATHHQSRTPTAWAAYSFAPLEAVFEAVFLPLFLLLVPMHVVIIVAFVLHQIGRNALGHAGHELMPSGFTRHWLGRWFTTTTHHDLHHSEGRHNFGLYFTWWDRMMGTEHPDYNARFEAVAQKTRMGLSRGTT